MQEELTEAIISFKLTFSYGISQRCQDRNILDNTGQFAMFFQATLVSQKDHDHEHALATSLVSFGLSPASPDHARCVG